MQAISTENLLLKKFAAKNLCLEKPDVFIDNVFLFPFYYQNVISVVKNSHSLN